MKLIDYIAVGILIALSVLATKVRKKSSCSGCCGSCAGCSADCPGKRS